MKQMICMHGSSDSMAAVQLAKMFEMIIATGTSGKKLEIVKSLGADRIVTVVKDGITAFREEVKDLTDGKN